MAFSVIDVAPGDVAAVRSRVSRRSGSGLNQADRDDIASAVMLEALVASERHALPFRQVAMHTAMRPRYYTRAKDALARADITDMTKVHPCAVDRSQLSADEVEWVDLVSCLPTHLAKAVWLVEWVRMTYQEAADHLGVTHPTVLRWREAGLLALRVLYDQAQAA